jgi:hypothetical protein
MTLHLCTVIDPKCWRCELALDEVDEPKPLTRRQLLAQEAEEAIERERAVFNAEDDER